MLVRDIAQTDPITVTPEASLGSILHLLNRKGVRHLLVVQYGRLVGIISIGDLALKEEQTLTGSTIARISKTGGNHSQAKQ